MNPLALALLLAAAAAAAPLSAQAPSEPIPAEGPEDVLGMDTDRLERMTVPVSIGGKGPYRFIVDTGSERTVIARELASDLALGAGNIARVHSMTEVSEIATAFIPTLEVGGRKVRDIHAPALERRNIGAEGMLGVDSLQAQRVLFDFLNQEMRVVPSRKREEYWPADTIVVTARNRFGHLVLVDASVDGQKVWVIIDTGAQVTVGNNALRRKLERKQRLGAVYPIALMSVTGGRIVADQTATKHMWIGGIEIRDMPIAFSDVHPFRKLGLMDRPAILLGMDVLRMFEKVSVDFANRKVRLLAPPRSERETGSRYARGEGTRPAI